MTSCAPSFWALRRMLWRRRAASRRNWTARLAQDEGGSSGRLSIKLFGRRLLARAVDAWSGQHRHRGVGVRLSMPANAKTGILEIKAIRRSSGLPKHE